MTNLFFKTEDRLSPVPHIILCYTEYKTKRDEKVTTAGMCTD
jgi:hypothetical protein